MIKDKNLFYKNLGYKCEFKNQGGNYLDKINKKIAEDSKILC